jgi:GPH family glycoside/pentoside/hexuronide:cation symporter
LEQSASDLVVTAAASEIEPKSLRPSVLSLTGFGVGSLGTGLFSTVPSFLLLYFMTEVLGVRPALAGVAVFTPKIWSIVTDPLMGALSDRTRTRLGRRRPYILAGGLLLPFLFALLFNPPAHLSEAANFLFALAVYGLGATAYAVFSVPYLAMPSEMSPDQHIRTEIMSFRMGFAMLGVLLGMAAAPALVDHFGGGREGYSHMAITLAVICACAMLTTFLSTSGATARDTSTTSSRLTEDLRSVLQDRKFRILIIVYGLQMIGASLFAAIAPYFVAQILRQSLSMLGLIFFVMLSATILALPLWTFAARRYGKEPALIMASILYAVCTAVLCFAGPSSRAWQIYPNVVLLGVAFGGIQLLPFSILTDVIHANGLKTGVWREGVFTGVWTSAEKASLAFGPLVAGAILSLTGFVNGASEPSVQPAASLLAIRILFAVAPATLLCGSAIVLMRYRAPKNT